MAVRYKTWSCKEASPYVLAIIYHTWENFGEEHSGGFGESLAIHQKFPRQYY